MKLQENSGESGRKIKRDWQAREAIDAKTIAADCEPATSRSVQLVKIGRPQGSGRCFGPRCNTAALFFSPSGILYFLYIMRLSNGQGYSASILLTMFLYFSQLFPVDCYFSVVKYLRSSLLIQSAVGLDCNSQKLTGYLYLSFKTPHPPHSMGRFRLLNDSLLSLIQGAGIACLHV